MQRVNEFVFYELALQVHQLAELESVNPIKYSEIIWQWSAAREALDGIFASVRSTSPHL
jgi:hypothetical protein